MKIARSQVVKINSELERYDLSLVELPPDGVGDTAVVMIALDARGQEQKVYIRISDE